MMNVVYWLPTGELTVQADWLGAKVLLLHLSHVDPKPNYEAPRRLA